MLVKNDFLVRPTFPPKSKLLYQCFLSASTLLIVRPQEKTRGGQDPVTARPQSCSTASQCVQGWSARPEDKRRTTAGQEKDKRRTRGGQDPATEPGRRVQAHSQSVWPALYSPNSLLLGFYLRKKELATLTGRAPELCGWALCPGLVLLLSFCVAGLCVQVSCPPLVLVLAAPLNSVAGLCGPVYWRGVWPNK